MVSTVTTSWSNRTPLGCDGTGDSNHGWAANKFAATVWCYGPNSLWNVSITLLNLCHKELMQSWPVSKVGSDCASLCGDLIHWINYTIYIESGITVHCAHFSFQFFLFVRVMHFLDEQHTWEVCEVPSNMSRIPILLKRSVGIPRCWCWLWCW